MSPAIFDVLVIGGGPAGLSLATGLARQVYSALVLDSGEYRNALSNHMHTVPGWDHADPAEFRAKARSDLAKRYQSIEFKSAKVSNVRRLDSGVFEAMDDQGHAYQGRKIGLATGVRDLVEEEVEGYTECWGRGIFHCMFCHGFEERGVESAGVLATGFIQVPERISHFSMMVKRLSKSTTIYTNGQSELADQVKPKIKSSKIAFDNRQITKFELENGGPAVRITFSDGTSKIEGFIGSHPDVEQRGKFIDQLALDMTPTGEIKVSPPMNETSVPGVFAAGDAATMMKSVLQAMQMGGFAAVGIIGQLQQELDATDEL